MFRSPAVALPALSRRGFLSGAAGITAGAVASSGARAQPEDLPDIPDEATGRSFPDADLQMPLPPGERVPGPNH